MKHFAWVVTAVVVLGSLSTARAQDKCAQFNQLVQQTFNFNADRLSEKQKYAKDRELDRFWTKVKANRKIWLPCLRAALAQPKVNPYFEFDGSNLLVALDPSTASKAQQVKAYTGVSFKLCTGRRWLNMLALRASEGFDVSQAAERWLTSEEGYYKLPEHGDWPIGALEGASILYGSMSEAKTTPALLRIIRQPDHPGVDIALSFLLMQLTPESIKALQTLNMDEYTPELSDIVTSFYAKPPLVQRRAKPRTTRAEFLRVFGALVKGNYKPFSVLMDKVPDGEKDVVAVMKPQDLPLLRLVRRQFAATDNPHAFALYADFSRIILTLVWKPEMKRPAAESDGVRVL